MARQKKIFTNNQITGRFLDQSQHYGRTSNSSMYFVDNKMFSYGEHFVMAVLSGNDLLIAKRNSTATTNKHLSSLAFDAEQRGFNVIEVANVEATEQNDHAFNINDLHMQIEHAETKLKRARKEWSVNMWIREIGEKSQAVEKYFDMVRNRVTALAS